MGQPVKKEPPVRIPEHSERAMSDPAVWKARGLYRVGMKITALAGEFKVSVPTMRAALRGTGAYEGT